MKKKKKQFKKQASKWKQDHPFTKYLDTLAGSNNPMAIYKGRKVTAHPFGS
jgi:hypothetical protein